MKISLMCCHFTDRYFINFWHQWWWLGLNTRNACQYIDNQSPEDGSRANSRNVFYLKYTSDSGQCPKVMLV